MNHDLREYLRAAYTLAGRQMPDGLERLAVETYTHDLQVLLEANGWMRDRLYPFDVRRIYLASEDGKLLVAINEDPENPDEWIGTLGLLAAWPRGWSKEQRLGHLKMFGIDPQTDQVGDTFGDPVCYVRFVRGAFVPHMLFPDKIESSPVWTRFRTFIRELGTERLVRGDQGWQEQLGSELAQALYLD